MIYKVYPKKLNTILKPIKTNKYSNNQCHTHTSLDGKFNMLVVVSTRIYSCKDSEKQNF